MKYVKILAATKTPEILAVIEGLPVDASGFFLSEEQMGNIEAMLVEAEGASAKVVLLTEQIATANTTAQTATAALETANTTIAARDAQITQLTNDLAEANAKPAGEIPGTKKDKDKVGTEKVAAHLDPTNSLNRAADQLYK